MESWGLYQRLKMAEQYVLRPGSAFRIGLLEFHVERFNTGIVANIGYR